MLTLQLLPAREGDAIWIRWGEPGSPHQMLIDMGTEETGRQLHERLWALPKHQRTFELVVVSHIDRDHIGGLLSCLVNPDPIPGLIIKEFWFNGLTHLKHPGNTGVLESLGPRQGEQLSQWLLGQGNWNLRFDGDAVCREGQRPLPTFEFADGLRLTVLGPTRERLKQLLPTWEADLEQALAAGRAATTTLERMGGSKTRQLDSLAELKQLADQPQEQDKSEANGSSIALLLEYAGNRILLGADAFAEDLEQALQLLPHPLPLQLAAFKVAHHGSRKNLSETLIKQVDCQHWLISSDGTRYKHPDDESMARIIHYSSQRPILGFNVPSAINRKWNNPQWRKDFVYCTTYGCERDGLTLGF